MMLKGNKGEWSELYVLFKLLGEGKIYSGDGLLNRLESFYPVLNILRDELDRHLEYLIDRQQDFDKCAIQPLYCLIWNTK